MADHFSAKGLATDQALGSQVWPDGAMVKEWEKVISLVNASMSKRGPSRIMLSRILGNGKPSIPR